jgi:AcrR family transcriptional regulator
LANPSRRERAVGRPRMFEDEAERRMLIEAAIRILASKGYETMTVSDVLTEAGLSTRAFYRHFASKTAVIDALLLREAESAGRALARVVDLAPDAVSALEAWIDRYLDIYYQPRRVRRARLLNYEVDRAITDAMRREMREIVCSPLIEVLRAGNEAGVLRSPTPELDAYSVHDLASIVGHANRFFAADKKEMPDRASARNYVVRFAWPALGLSPNGRKNWGSRHRCGSNQGSAARA